MVARVKSVVFQGTNVLDVDVRVQMSDSLPAFTIVGLPDKAGLKAASACARRWARWRWRCRRNGSPSI